MRSRDGPRADTRPTGNVQRSPGITVASARPGPTRAIPGPDRESHPARRKVRDPAAIGLCGRWRDPDSNRGHHDFQSLRRARPRARNPWKTSASAATHTRRRCQEFAGLSARFRGWLASHPLFQPAVAQTVPVCVARPRRSRSPRVASLRSRKRPYRGCDSARVLRVSSSARSRSPGSLRAASIRA